MKAKEQLRLIFGFSKKKEIATEVKKEKPKEEKKQPPQKIEKRIIRKIITTPKIIEESKVKPEELATPAITFVDAATQTERIDFQKARTKWIMAKFGKSRTQYKKSASTFT